MWSGCWTQSATMRGSNTSPPRSIGSQRAGPTTGNTRRVASPGRESGIQKPNRAPSPSVRSFIFSVYCSPYRAFWPPQPCWCLPTRLASGISSPFLSITRCLHLGASPRRNSFDCRGRRRLSNPDLSGRRRDPSFPECGVPDRDFPFRRFQWPLARATRAVATHSVDAGFRVAGFSERPRIAFRLNQTS